MTDQRALAVEAFNRTWTYLSREELTPVEVDEMLHTAHASRFHWDAVGGDKERSIGEWQIARVCGKAGLLDAAQYHARRAIAYAESDGVPVWVLAGAYEGLARALCAAGQLDEARVQRDHAREILASVPADEDTEWVGKDIDSLPLD